MWTFCSFTGQIPRLFGRRMLGRQAMREPGRPMEEAYQAGKVRAIGVSNFMIHHLEALLETADIKPHVNQVLLAPGCTQDELVAFCRQHEILLEAYSPLGTGSIFDNPVAQELAAKYGKSRLLSWLFVGPCKRASFPYQNR